MLLYRIMPGGFRSSVLRIQKNGASHRNQYDHGSSQDPGQIPRSPLAKKDGQKQGNETDNEPYDELKCHFHGGLPGDSHSIGMPISFHRLGCDLPSHFPKRPTGVASHHRNKHEGKPQHPG